MVGADDCLTDEDLEHDDVEDDEFDDCGEEDCDADDASIGREDIDRRRRAGEIAQPMDIDWPSQKAIKTDAESAKDTPDGGMKDGELKMESPSFSASSPPQDGDEEDDSKPASDADLEVGPVYLARLLPVFSDIAQTSLYPSVR